MGLFSSFRGESSPVISLNNIQFISSDHKRFERGVHVSGPHQGGARRGIEIIKNRNGRGYLVTIHNLEGVHPLWGNNIQMAQKQMEVLTSDSEITVLRGFGNDNFGFPFSGYGITILHPQKVIEKITLHMHDRGVDIEYFK